jgi:hypothetical protein
MIVWGFAKQGGEERVSQTRLGGQETARVRRTYTIVDEGLIAAIIEEIDRVWGGLENFDGTYDQYDWLLEHYGITEEEDVWWQIVLEDNTGDLASDHPEDAEDEDVISFLGDEQAIQTFLEHLLQKYRSNTLTYTA